MKVLKPTKNKLTGGYSVDHKGYDHDDIPDTNYKSSFFGKVVQCKNSETRNWIANKKGDPYKPATGTRKLKTEDYGNYIKIKGTVDGKTVYQLGAHFKQGTVLPVGTEVSAGQTVAQIGNTGNSTGSHCHTEYRDEKDVNFSVELVDEIENEKPKPMDTKEQIIIDTYKAVTGEYPSDDEKRARLQKNENTVELIEDLLTGDGRAKSRWLQKWDNEDNDIVLKEMIEQYKTTLYSLKEILGVSVGSDNETLIGKARGLSESLTEAQNALIPKTVYKVEGKDFSRVFKIGNITLIIEK